MIDMVLSVAEQGPSILLVNGAANSVTLFRRCARALDCELLLAKGEEALEVAQRKLPSVILLDIGRSNMDNLEICRRLKMMMRTENIATLFVLGKDVSIGRLRGYEAGASGFIARPLEEAAVQAQIQVHLTIHQKRVDLQAQMRKLKIQLQVAQELLRETSREVEGVLLGESEHVQQLHRAIDELAPSDKTVLMIGPQGAGFEAVARSLHRRSSRESQMFFHINCNVLKNAESPSLFSFSANDMVHTGESTLELTDGGTLFFDRIENLPMNLQGQLLVYLQEASMFREQGIPPVPDVRIMSYASDELSSYAKKGRFLPALIPYLSQRRIQLPGLIERKDDIQVIAEHFLRQQTQKLGKLIDRISPESMELLLEYVWPGNVVELQGLIEQQVKHCQTSVLVIDQSLLEGGQAVGGYQLLDQIGVGGMGEIWRAKHQLLARPAAFKRVNVDEEPDVDIRNSFLSLFQREARVTAQLCSPHTVQLFDFGVDESGSFYYVMELLEGLDLSQMVRRFGPLPPARVIHILRGICLSLQEAHELGMVHRDIKPGNIFLSRQGVQFDFPKVLDFGIVKEQWSSASCGLKKTGVKIFGSPGYCAPEYLSDKPFDHRFDLYSLGSVAFWSLVGHRIFNTLSGSKTMAAQIRTGAWRPSNFSPQPIPRALDDLIHSCLKRDSSKRPVSARVMLQQLERLAIEHPWTNEQAEEWWYSNLLIEQRDDPGEEPIIVLGKQSRIDDTDSFVRPIELMSK